jgi:hypothetical protein
MISARTAFLLYGVLVLGAVLTLKGKLLGLALVIVLAFAAKTYVDHVRRQR